MQKDVVLSKVMFSITSSGASLSSSSSSSSDSSSSSEDTDLEWTTWLARNMEELELIKEKNKDNKKRYYELTTAGKDLIERITNQWKKKFQTRAF